MTFHGPAEMRITSERIDRNTTLRGPQFYYLSVNHNIQKSAQHSLAHKMVVFLKVFI